VRCCRHRDRSAGSTFRNSFLVMLLRSGIGSRLPWPSVMAAATAMRTTKSHPYRHRCPNLPTQRRSRTHCGNGTRVAVTATSRLRSRAHWRLRAQAEAASEAKHDILWRCKKKSSQMKCRTHSREPSSVPPRCAPRPHLHAQLRAHSGKPAARCKNRCPQSGGSAAQSGRCESAQDGCPRRHGRREARLAAAR
jgi:hypothetical protein